MELQLQGKTAFVSGSTQGIGFTIAAGLVREGVAVTVNGRDEGRVRAAVERLEAISPHARVTGIAADFADPTQVETLTQALGPIDILINNVGLFGLEAFDQVTDAQWRRYFDVNVMSGVRLSRHVLPGMLDRKSGRIIFVGSESGVNIPSDMVHYGVTKAAMLALSNGLAKQTRGTAVTVNTILGGPTYSDGVAQAVKRIAQSNCLPIEEMKASIIGTNQTSLLQRFLNPQEIANLAVFLASPLSSATNGAALRADGGVLTAML